MKSINVIFTAASCLVVASLSSCDSGPITDPSSAAAHNLTSESMDAPVAGDTIQYQTNGNTVPITTGFTYQGINNSVGGVTYTYTRTGDHEFTHVATTMAEANLINALDAVISGRLGAQLGNRIRTLLRQGPPYSNANLIEITQILNPAGANLVLNPTGTGLRTLGTLTYTHEVTSTNLTRINGSMGGVYRLDSIGNEVIFRNLTQGEANQWREMSINNFIPVLSNAQYGQIGLEQGTWVSSLINSP